MLQPNYSQIPQNLYPQPCGANAVSINIYNPQAYGSMPQANQIPYNYTNSMYQMPQAQVYNNSAPVQLPPAQYYLPNAQQQTPAVINQPVVQQEYTAPVYVPQQAPIAIAQPPIQQVLAPAPQMMPDSVIPAQPVVNNTVNEAAEQNNSQEKDETIPSIDTEALIKDLRSSDTSFKGDAINKIASYAQEKPEIALQIVSEPIMQALVDVIKEDTTSLDGPTNKQIEIAEKISKGEELTPEEDALSEQLSPRDKANKNRIFALYTLAMIQKLQRDELSQYIATQKANGEQSIEPLKLEDLIGYDDVVNVINNDARPEVKVAAIQALEHVAEPEDKARVESILANALNSSDEPVKLAAQEAMSKFAA